MKLNYTLSTIANIIAGQLHGSDLTIDHLAIDSRQVKQGDCFLALQGENFDGNQFVEAAIKQGAIAAIVSRPTQLPIPHIIVSDTRHALIALASYHRQQFSLPVVGITGSCGKTTTRAMLASICQLTANTLASIKSFNNEIGVPLTLLELTSAHEIAIVEIGTNHFGEIAKLTAIAKPSIAMIVSIGPVHIEFLENEQGVAREKSDIFAQLPAEGFAIYEHDSPYQATFNNKIGQHHRITFGFTEKAMVWADEIQQQPDGTNQFNLHIKDQQTKIHLPLLAQHNISNALAAAAAATVLGIKLETIKTGLQNVSSEQHRLTLKKAGNGALIIDDSYNANPRSMRAAIDLLSHYQDKKTLLIMGDMGELGEKAESYHEQIGDYARAKGIAQLYAYGKLSAQTVSAFGENAQHFSTHEALIAAVKKQFNEHISNDSVILVKGSYSMKMWQVIEELMHTNEETR